MRFSKFKKIRWEQCKHIHHPQVSAVLHALCPGSTGVEGLLQAHGVESARTLWSQELRDMKLRHVKVQHRELSL